MVLKQVFFNIFNTFYKLLQSNHYGIETGSTPTPFQSLKLQSNHYGIETNLCTYKVTQAHRLQSNHYGIETT